MKEMKESKVKTFFFCLWVIIAVLLIQAGVSVIGILPKAVQLMLETGGMGEEYMKRYQEYAMSGPVLMTLQFTAEIVCIVVLGIWYYFGYVRKDKQKGIYKPIGKKYNLLKDTGFILSGCLAAWALAVLLQIIVSSLMPKTNEAVGEMLNTALGGGTQWMGIVTAVILAPICEELTVRGIILQRSKRAFGVVGCVVMSAVMFGIFHLNPIQGIYVLPLGLFWGFVGYKKNSFIPCVFCHMLNNALGLFIPASVNAIVMFIVFGVLTALIGVKTGYMSNNDTVDDVDNTVEEV
ncbi:MAG: CPBP family intramembrane metalloprotease [Lachnospiraceae bacterium]|nr:CPBP family intramembrane metalloprotease [Lachnospiraceae bacterium]